MKKSRFSEEQIIAILKEQAAGMKTGLGHLQRFGSATGTGGLSSITDSRENIVRTRRDTRKGSRRMSLQPGPKWTKTEQPLIMTPDKEGAGS